MHHDGTEVVIREWYKEINELGNTLYESMTHHQLPQAIEKLRRGETLDFETMTLSQEGIQVEKKLIPWSDIKSAKEVQDWLQIARKSKGASLVSLTKTANPHLFLTLAERAIQSERQ